MFKVKFLILSVGVSLAPKRGARATAVKLNPLKYKVKFWRCGLFTVVLTFFFNFFCPHVVDSIFLCRFEYQSKTNNQNDNNQKHQ